MECSSPQGSNENSTYHVTSAHHPISVFPESVPAPANHARRRNRTALSAQFTVSRQDPYFRAGEIQHHLQEKEAGPYHQLPQHPQPLHRGAPGGGHKILWVAPEGAKWVPHFAKLGVSTIILRNRLHVDGYEPTTDATYFALQAVRIVRANATKWKIDPKKIGIIGFSAGAELVTSAALFFEEFEKNNSSSEDLNAGFSARPDLIGVIYPGPSPFSRDANTKIPSNAPQSFIACSGVTEKIHAVCANEWFTPMLNGSWCVLLTPFRRMDSTSAGLAGEIQSRSQSSPVPSPQ